MKATVFLIILFSLKISAEAYSQRISVSFKNASMKKVIWTIRKQSQTDFIYDPQYLKNAKPVTVDLRNVPLEDALQEIFKGQPFSFTYEPQENAIIIMPRRKVPPPAAAVRLQQMTVSGTVTDPEGVPLIGASVLVRESDIGVATDLDGKFEIENVHENATLVFSYVGYQTLEVPVNGRGVLSVVLTPDSEILEEMVVVGYGTQKKVNLTGSVAAIEVDESMRSRALSNVSSGLAGMLPGLTATQNSAMAGNDGAELLIRGIGSPNESSPLIVVDGIPDININNLNMNDIQSVSVLKDASSASIYGSRGANGVILITTKRGANKAMQINYTGNISRRSYTNYYDATSDYPQYMQMHNRSHLSGGGSEQFLDGTIEQWMAMGQIDPIRFPNTDWWDVLFKPGILTNHSISASGGTAKVNYYISVGSMDDSGISVNTSYNRKNFRSNLDASITDNIKVGINLDGTWTEQSYAYPDGVNNLGQSNIRWDIIKNSPGTAPMDEQGRYSWNMAYREHSANRNIYATIMNRHNNFERQAFTGNIFASWEAVSGLVFRFDYAQNLRYQSSNSYDTPFLRYNFQTEEVLNKLGPNYGDIENVYNHDGKSLLQARVNYDVDLIEGHHLSFMGAYAEEFWHGKFLRGSRGDRIHPGLYEINSALLERPPTAGGSSYGEGLRSWIGRLNYNIREKYLFEANTRADASSKFVDGYQWGIFPSVSAAWRLSEEDFFHSNVITDAKIRGSWGSLGNNSGVGRYEQQNTYALTNYSFGQTLSQGVSSTKMVNPDFSWEKTTAVNLGLDLVLFSRLSTEIDVYERTTSDIIRPSELSTILAGFSAPRTNIGDLRNRGIELNLTWHDNIQSFNYSVRFNYSHNRNKLLSWNQRLGLGEPHLDFPLSFIYTYKAIGLAQTWEDIYNAPYQGSANIAPGDILYQDLNGDGKIDENDRVALRNSPRSFFNNHYGLLFDVSWKNFDLNVLLQASSGSKDFWYDNYNMPYPNGSRYTYNQQHLDAWTLNNRYDPTLPRLMIGNRSRNDLLSDYWLYSRDYIRLKNLQLGYNLPVSLLRKVGLSNVRAYVTGENIFTITGWPGIDPEKPGGAGKELSNPYPLTRSFSFGVNVTI